MMDESEDTGGSAIVGYPNLILFTIAIGTMTMMTGLFVLSPFLPVLIEDLSISPSRAGLALTVMWAFYALSQYPGGSLSDQLSNKTVIVTSTIILMVGFSMLTVTMNYAQFLSGVIVIGIGAGLYVPTSLAQLSDLFVARRGQAFGLNTASLNLGGALSAWLAISTLTFLSWRVAFVPILVLLLVVTVCMHVWNREPYVVATVSFSLRETISEVRQSASLVRLAVIASIFSFVYQGTVSFLPTMLQAEKGVSSTTAGYLFAVFFLFGIVVNPLAGRIGDWVGHVRTALATSLVAMLGVLITVIASGLAAISVGVSILAVGLLPFWTVMNTQLITYSSDRSQGGVFGLIRSGYLMIGSFGPVVVGVIAEATNYLVAFEVYVVSLLAVILLLSVQIYQVPDRRSVAD